MTARRVLVWGGGLALALLSQGALAQDAAEGRLKARQCSGCHGQLGIAAIPNAPNLAGEASMYIEAQLKAFRDGDRQHDQMTIVAAKLDDKDIADLAAWFEAIEVTVAAPDLD